MMDRWSESGTLLSGICSLLLIAVVSLGCGGGDGWPAEVEQGISEFTERAKWIKHLDPPAGAVAGAIGGSSTRGDREWFEFSVETSSSSAEVMEHYESQLIERGWNRQEQLSEGTVELRTYNFLGAESLPWHGILVVTESAVAPDRRVVTLRLTRLVE